MYNGLGARFVSPIPQSELQDRCKPFIPNQTKSNNSWAMRVFKAWVTKRNKLSPDDLLPEDMLEVKYLVEIQDKSLAAFILEARHADGKPYPGTTLKNIAAALFHVMKQNLAAVNVLRRQLQKSIFHVITMHWIVC